MQKVKNNYKKFNYYYNFYMSKDFSKFLQNNTIILN